MRPRPNRPAPRSLAAAALAALALAVALLASATGPAEAQRRGRSSDSAPAGAPGGSAATLVATFSDWSAYTAQTGRAKICYALSQPKSRTPANLKDTPAYLFVSFRPADKVSNEVAAVLNFDTKDGGPAAMAIGGTSYDLVTKGKNAWVKNPAEEGAAIGAMSKGRDLNVSATSARGNKTTDKYSLAGFAQALERAKKECP